MPITTSFDDELYGIFGKDTQVLDGIKKIVSSEDDVEKECRHLTFFIDGDNEVCKLCGFATKACQHLVCCQIDVSTLLCEDCGCELTVQCEHTRYSEVEGNSVCEDCGCEVKTLDYQPEWRFYGSSDSRNTGDPSRCHRTKESTRGGIDKVFQDHKLLHIPQSIRKKTEVKYKLMVGNDTVRGKGRRARVAACLLFVYRDESDNRTSDEIRGMFDLTKQEMSVGLTHYHATFPEDRVKHLNPPALIQRVMKKMKINIPRHYRYILRIARCLEKTDGTLTRSNPASVAAAIVYLYLCLTPKLKKFIGLTKTKFARQMKLSDITITKLVRQAASVIGLTAIEM